MIIVLLLSWLLLIAIEITRNWFIIEVKHEGPNHLLGSLYRAAIGIMWFIVFFKLGFLWYWLIPFQLFSFWFLFDTFLNIARGKPIAYLDDPKDAVEDSIIDTISQKLFHVEVIFYLKLILFIGATSIIIAYGTMTWNEVNFK